MKKISIFSLLMLMFLVSAAEVDPVTIRAQGGTGFKINDLREFEFTDDTVYKEDGQVIPQTRAQGGTGYKIRYRVTDPSPNLLQGTLDELDLINDIKGPVVGLSPLRVFDVNKVVTAQTFIADGTSLAGLQLGDQLKLSGYVDNGSQLLVTRIERVSDLNVWKLSGLATNVTSTTMRIGQQLVNYQASDLQDCSGSLIPGTYVEIDAQPIVGFMLGDPLNTVTRIQCVDRTVFPEDNDGVVIIEGVVDLIEPDEDFVLSGQTIDVVAQTKFIRGRQADLQEGIRVVVEGNADLLTGEVLADKVRFIAPRVNLTVPVEPTDFTGNQFNVAGVVLNVTPQTLDPDGVLSGLTETTQLQFRGYDYGGGDLYITRINERGNADYNDVSLTGEVSGFNQPVLYVFGVVVDAATSLLFDQDGLPLNENEFFAMLVAGAEVELEGGTLDQLTGELSGGELTLLGLPEVPTAGAQGGTGVRGRGTISATPDVIFVGSFDTP